MMRDRRSSAVVLWLAVICCGTVTLVNGQVCQRSNDGTTGRCVSVYECASATRLMRRGGLTLSDANYLRSLQCQGDSGSYPWVCCEATPVDPPDVQFPNEDGTGTGSGTRSSMTTSSTTSTTTKPVVVTRPASSDGAQTRGGAFAELGVCGLDAFGQRIYGGQAAGLNEFPWMALLQYRNTNTGERMFNCGGTLINSRYVLTAAHCVMNNRPELVLSVVRLGEYDLSSQRDCVDGDCADPALDVDVAEIVAHPGFDMTARNQANDVALLRLAYDVSYTEFIQPVCMPSTLSLAGSAPNAILFASGWGRTLKARQSSVKLKVQLPVVEHAVCREKYAAIRAKIVDSQLCAGSLFAVDTCDGDSGGPLMAVKNNYWAIEGIVSFGRACGLEGWPAIYTRVASFEDWILQTIRD